MSSLYIGRQVKHFEKVEVQSIRAEFSEPDETTARYRYRLILPYAKEQGRTKRASVVLKNPSSADAKMADKTVQNVAKVVYKTFKDVAEVEILNLFAVRGTMPADVMSDIEAGKDVIGKDNNQHIKEALSYSDYIVIAWGGHSPIKRSIYDQRVDEVLQIIYAHGKTAMIYRKANRGSEKYPFHACYWPDNEDFEVVGQAGLEPATKPL